MPGLLFAGAAWKSRVDIQHLGDAMILNAVAILGDTVRDQLQTEELALKTVADRLRGLSWADVDRADTSAFLAALKNSLHQVRAISVLDRNGNIRATSQIADRGRRILDQKFFANDRDGTVYISMTAAGQIAQPVSLALIRRYVDPDSAVDGTIRAELDPGGLRHLFALSAPIEHDVLLFGADGDALGERRDQAELAKLTAGAPLLRQVAAHPEGGLYSGKFALGGSDNELYSYRRIPGYSVWVGLAVDQAALLMQWYRSLAAYATAAAAGALALLMASWIAIRHAGAEHQAFLLLQAETERRLHAEQRMRQTHRLEAIGQLAAGIAHDFNNLLAVIMGGLDLIARTSGLSDRIQSFVTMAHVAAERGARLTSSLLAFGQRQIMQTDTVKRQII